jgi:hypothetical protein
MSRPPERLRERPVTGNPTENRAAELLRTLQEPPRLEASRSARLDQAIGRLSADARRSGWRWTTIAVPALALAILVVAIPAVRRGSHEESRARGPGSHAAVAATPALLVYRMGPGGHAEPLRDTIRRSDELAFAYRSDGKDDRLMVFARDEGGRIYWYHPAWTDPAQDPEAVAIAREPGVHELPAAVSHAFAGNRVEICALFTTGNRRVRETEADLVRGALRADCRKVTVTP